MGYTEVIYTAVIFFPIIAFIFTLPFILHQYRKYGSIPIIRSIIIYSFIFYLICIYFLVILPLPAKSEVAKLLTPRIQPIPFKFISDISDKTNFNIKDFSTFIPALENFTVLQVLFNIAMTIPFGIYLRYYFKRSLISTSIFSFCLSLFFELTQITGLYFIYPRSYRMFDVDDLIMNTLGGIIGYAICPLVCFLLPKREKIDENSFRKGRYITLFRRGIAFFTDNIFILAILIICCFALNKTSHITFMLRIISFFYFTFSTFLFKGGTIGKKLMKIKVKSEKEENLRFINILSRYAILYIVILGLPKYVSFFFSDKVSAVFDIFYVCFFTVYIIVIRFKKLDFCYERISKTKLISTVKINCNTKKTDDNVLKDE